MDVSACPPYNLVGLRILSDNQDRAPIFMDDSVLSLQSIHGLHPIYLLPGDPFVHDVLIPGFTTSSNVDCMVGFFSSRALASLAPGLATFINNSDGRFRLIISPVLSFADWEAIEAGVNPLESVVGDLLSDLLITSDAIQRFTLECLTWLIRHGRIDIRIALLKTGFFHPKVWLFHDDNHQILSAHGSSNLTQAGIGSNIEQIAVSRSWLDANELYTTQRLDAQFRTLWDRSDEDCIVVTLPDAIREQLVKTYSTSTPPQETALSALYERAMVAETSAPYSVESQRNHFRIPTWLRYQEGPFAHQGKAVNAWCDAGYQGILEMATGSGKTITAMICAHKLYEQVSPLLVVVAAPYVPLIQQWCDEIEPFGISPVNLSATNGRKGRARILGRLRRRLRSGSSDVEAVVVSHRTLSDEGFQAELRRFDCTKLLVADEAHNLGSEGFIANPPTFFEHKIGLSATPVRQYDAEGTEALFDFLGPVVFQFTLEEAIGTCLVEYDYFVHEVYLTENEMGRWHELTERIRASAWRQEEGGAPDDYLTKLLRDRRAILEVAENKIPALRAAIDLEDLPNLSHTLVYTSDKGPEQLDDVNQLLNDRGLLFHQLTYEETGDRERTSRILRAFQDGTLKVLTAKRVLDEGVNIPQIQKAFILASTTVERQWVQRRGRLLRQCREIGKTHSEVHDFLALPPEMDTDPDVRTLIRSELERVQEFARLARNAGRPDGPLAAIDRLVQTAFG